MAWQLGPYSVRRGSSILIAFWWDNDPGVQVIQALPFDDGSFGGGGIIVNTTSAVEIVEQRIENEPGRGNIPRFNTQITYFVRVAAPPPYNNSSGAHADPVTFHLRGAKV